MCTTCSDNICSCGGITIPIGPTGASGTNGTNGENGLFGGYSSDWLYDATSILSNPPARYFRFNNVLPTGAGEIYINKFNWGNDNIEPFLTEFDNSGNYGKIRVFKEFDNNVYFWYNIIGFSQAGNVTTLSVEYISGNGTLVTDDQCVITFSSNGTQSLSQSISDVTNTKTIDTLTAFSLFDTPITVNETGNYILMFEGDYSHISAVLVSFFYYFIKNATNTAIGINNSTEKRFIANNSADTIYTKITHNTYVSLTAGDTVNVNLDAVAINVDPGLDTIGPRSLVLIKVS